jgi:hypothetical protein
MKEVYFLARHTPFWAIPMFVLSAEFGYVFWLRKKKKGAIFCLFLALIGAGATGFYYWAGGPEKSVKFLKKIHRNYN